MIEVIKSGTLKDIQHFKALAGQYRSLVLPSDDDGEATHYWVIRKDGGEILYVGTPETFAAFTREQNGGVQ
jgi:hypothetical protein